MTIIESIFVFLRSSKGKTMNESIAYARGVDAYYEGDALSDNPYQPNDLAYSEWLNGWYAAAQKTDPTWEVVSGPAW